MRLLGAALRLDLLLQFRYGFYYAAAFTTLVWIALLSALPESALYLAVPFMIFADVAVVGYYFIAGMVLFEKGEATLFALVSTPLRFGEYLASKLATLSALAVVMSLIVVVASYGFAFDAALLMLGVIPSLLPAVAPVALHSGLMAPLVALILVVFAANKVEGLALMKGLAVFMLGPLAAFFMDSSWQLLLGVLPTYWPAKAFWVAGEGGNFWPYILVGLIYNLLLLIVLLCRFETRVF